MAGDGVLPGDIEIVASAAIDRLQFKTQPRVQISFPGTGKRDGRQVTRREKIETPVQPGKTYRRVSVATRISSRLLDPE